MVTRDTSESTITPTSEQTDQSTADTTDQPMSEGLQLPTSDVPASIAASMSGVQVEGATGTTREVSCQTDFMTPTSTDEMNSDNPQLALKREYRRLPAKIRDRQAG